MTTEQRPVKVEVGNTPLLKREADVLKSLGGGVGIPNVLWDGTTPLGPVMILDLLGPNLEDLFAHCGRKFSPKTVLLLAIELISRLEYIHSKSIIHRDIKPENFTVGWEKKDQIYIIDFGLAKEYRPGFRRSKIVGTARFTSINSHLGLELSRRDDLESLGYVMLYFLRGKLPWQDLATRRDKFNRILEVKKSISSKELCDGFPEEFCIYLDYVRSLDIDQTPDYSYLRKIFRDCLAREDQGDLAFDWFER